jgi:GNAT superfamily N-acetyltransferase
VRIRSATPDDAHAISDVLEELVAAKKRAKPGDPAFVLRHYIEHPDRIQCAVAVDEDDTILGLQSLKIARETNPYGTPVGWGIIGTHVRPSAARRGVGRQLFPATLTAAQTAGLEKIEAYIGAGNEAALTYYEAMGFRTWRGEDGAICKAYDVSSVA